MLGAGVVLGWPFLAEDDAREGWPAVPLECLLNMLQRMGSDRPEVENDRPVKNPDPLLHHSSSRAHAHALVPSRS